MSIVKCMVQNLPNALKDALISEIGLEKAEIFVEALINVIKSESWSVFHPFKDIKQLKEALEKAAKSAGINWDTIKDVAIDTALAVGKKCFGFASMSNFVETMRKNPKLADKVTTAVVAAIAQQGADLGFEISISDVRALADDEYNDFNICLFNCGGN